MDNELDALHEAAVEPADKKTWRAPQVVRQALSDAEHTGHLSADFSVAS
jgi:hypothetical protein